MQNKTLTFILAGGVGSRLFPLTSRRSKPSVPFGGKYRIIDFTLANCLHSVLRRILFHDIYIDDKATINKSILFDGVHVGVGAKLQNCIVDKNVRIPAMEQIGYDLEQDRQRFTVSENGIVVVPEGYTFE